MKLQRRHWLGNFAWRVEMTRQGTARDTKINIIEFEFPLCILLLCVRVDKNVACLSSLISMSATLTGARVTNEIAKREQKTLIIHLLNIM